MSIAGSLSGDDWKTSWSSWHWTGSPQSVGGPRAGEAAVGVANPGEPFECERRPGAMRQSAPSASRCRRGRRPDPCSRRRRRTPGRSPCTGRGRIRNRECRTRESREARPRRSPAPAARRGRATRASLRGSPTRPCGAVFPRGDDARSGGRDDRPTGCDRMARCRAARRVGRPPPRPPARRIPPRRHSG